MCIVYFIVMPEATTIITKKTSWLKRTFIEPPLCADCGPLPMHHWENYLAGLSGSLFSFTPPYVLSHGLEIFLTKFFGALGLVKKISNFPYSDVSLRTTIFIDEAKKRGMTFEVLRGPAGFLNYFVMRMGHREHLFEGLPRAPWLSGRVLEKIDDKMFIKKRLAKEGIPVAEGKSFSWFSIERAVRYAKKLGFPLVIKPKHGSMSQHVTVNIQDEDALHDAIRRVLRYAPSFIVERYIPHAEVYRATVIDEYRIACVKRVPAHIVGDGVHTVAELVDIKNNDPARGLPKAKDTTCYKLVIDNTTHQLLIERGLTLVSIPKAGDCVWLQTKMILDLGADLFEVTPHIHPDNAALFRKIAEFFGLKLVGIDFLAEDISKSWKEQNAVILELNSLPYIDMHHFPTTGAPVNVAGYITDMVEKYY